MKSKQRGMGAIGILFVLVGIVLVAVLGMKVGPAYIEYFSVKKIVAEIEASDVKTPQEIRQAFQRRADVDYLSSVTPADLSIGRDGISFAYQKRIPLFANVSLVIDFAGGAE